MRKSKTIGEHAIVIGGGIAGLVGARVLAEHFRKVTIIDRDQLQSSGYRKGVPQANHVHVLLRRGVELLEEAFPGITKEMESDGIRPLDFARDLCWCQYGGWLPREASDIITYPQTRPSLEAYIRKRVLALGNVAVRDSTTVRSLLTTADRRRVTGVQVTSKQDVETTADIHADLVLDAGGRSSPIIKWLTAMGYDAPETTRLPIDLCYVTRTYEPTKEARDWRALWVSPLAPSVPRGGALHTVEGNRWLVSLCGYHGHHPPLTQEGFLAFAKELYHPALYNAIKDAKPISESHIFRVPEERWNHFERMAEFPAGLLVIGDAYCIFDPIFGQGMSMALVEANILKDHLSKLESVAGVTEAWGKSYFQLCMQWLRGIWYFVSAEALRYPELPGERSWLVRFFQWYVVELYRVSHRFPNAYLEFIKLTHMTSGPAILLHPKIMIRMAQRALERLVSGAREQELPPLGEVPRRDGAGGRSDVMARSGMTAAAENPSAGVERVDRREHREQENDRVPTVLLSRYMGRLAGNMLIPRLIGARDRLCHYDKQPPLVPEQEIGLFLRDAIEAQGLQREAGELKAFLDHWQPIQGLSFLKKTLIEFSVTTNNPGLGMMLYGENRRMTAAFSAYCRKIGVYNTTVDLCCAICDTFRASDLCMVRAEFKPGGPTRYSIASSWYFDILRDNFGFNDKMQRLPARFHGKALADRVRSFSAALAPHYYPLFFGMSLLEEGTLESKMYLVRFDEDRSPFYRGSTLWEFIQSMGLPAQEMDRLKEVTELLWTNSKDKMTQIVIEVSQSQASPKRVNLVYCGTKISAIKQAIASFGYIEVSGQSCETFERMMQTDYVKYVGIRITPKGVSPRFKLYGQAMFDLTEPNVRMDGLSATAEAQVQAQAS